MRRGIRSHDRHNTESSVGHLSCPQSTVYFLLIFVLTPWNPPNDAGGLFPFSRQFSDLSITVNSSQAEARGVVKCHWKYDPTGGERIKPENTHQSRKYHCNLVTRFTGLDSLKQENILLILCSKEIESTPVEVDIRTPDVQWYFPYGECSQAKY